ncbi:MAG: HU family DNA-binding protein [Kiritimatiellae bacterium]|jgi:DNA-binding protein HU-beta|nr:HU family DNA-binding protein [Kiritimatiellia bacterium]
MAAKPKTKTQVIATLAEKTDLSKKDVTAVLENLAQMAYKEAKVGFTIPGLGKLVVVNRKARDGRNPATGETIRIPAKKVLKFRIAKAAKDAINEVTLAGHLPG